MFGIIPRIILGLKSEMLFLKLAYFFLCCHDGAYISFLTLFLIDVGLTLPGAGFISGMTFLAATVFCPLWGLLVDVTGRKRLIFFLLSTATTCCALAMPLSANHVNRHPRNMTTNVTTSDSHPHPHPPFPPHPPHLPIFFGKNFYPMLVLDVCSMIFKAPLPAMLDAAVMNILDSTESTSHYGGQRIFGALSLGLGALLSGVVIDLCKNFFLARNLSPYTGAFILQFFFMIIAIPICLKVLSQAKPLKSREEEEEAQRPSVSKLKLVIGTFSSFKNISFLIVVFIQGLGTMTMLFYLFLIMKFQMHAPKSMMGLAFLVQCLSNLLIFPFADKIIDLIGGNMVAMEIGMLSYCVRFLVNSFIRGPWLVLLTQILHGLGFALFWTATVKHTKSIASPDIYVTTFTVINAMFFGISGLIANMAGGLVIGHYGAPALFRGVGVLCGITFLAMVAANHMKGILRRFRSRESVNV